jgi:hypothetical protein
MLGGQPKDDHEILEYRLNVSRASVDRLTTSLTVEAQSLRSKELRYRQRCDVVHFNVPGFLSYLDWPFSVTACRALFGISAMEGRDYQCGLGVLWCCCVKYYKESE